MDFSGFDQPLPTQNQSPQARTSSQTVSTPQRQPGSWLTRLLPIAGATLATLAAPETGGLSLAGLAAAGGLGALGGGLGKIAENKVENIQNPNLKQPLLSGFGKQAELGAIGGAGGELLSPVVGKAFGGLTKLFGKGSGEVASQTVGETAANAGEQTIRTAASAGKGDIMRANVRALDNVIAKTPGLSSNVADNVARINQFADKTALKEYGVSLTGGAAKQGRAMPTLKAAINDKLGAAFAADTTKPFTTQEVKNALQKAVEAHPLYPTSLTGDTSAGNALTNSLTNAHNMVDNMAIENGGKFSVKDLNNLRQQIDRGINFNANPQGAAAINNEAGNAMRQTLNEQIKSNPEIARLIKHQQNAIILEKGLATNAGRAVAQQGGVMARPTGFGVRLPGTANIVQTAQDATGRSLQELSANPVKSVLSRFGPQALTQNLANEENQRTAQVGAQKLSQTDFTSLDPAVQQLVDKHLDAQQNNPTGLDPQKIQEAMVMDLKQTGGKNIAHLNTILSTITKLQAENSLPPSAVTKVSEYSNSLQMLKSISDAYNSNASGNDLTQKLNDANKILGKATGVSGKPLAALLPSPYDNGDTVATKLAQLKQLIDQNYSQQIQQAVDSKKNSADQTSFLGGLLGSSPALAGAQ